MSNYVLVCDVCGSDFSVLEGSRVFAEYNKCVNDGLDFFDWCGSCQKETKQKIEKFPFLFKRRRKVKETITELLKHHNLKTSDLSVKFQDWEARLGRIDTEKKLKDFQIEIQEEIRKQKTEQIIAEGRKKTMFFFFLVVLLALVIGFVSYKRKRK